MSTNSEYVTRNRQQKRDFLNQMKSELGCVGCQNTEPIVLDFHHLDPSSKEHSVSYMLSRNRSLKDLLGEAEKCVVLCANCHRLYHAGMLKLG